MIEEAAEQMTELLDELGAAARIEAGRWEPALREVDTLELARGDDERVAVEGEGETIETDAGRRSLGAAVAGGRRARHGPVERVQWTWPAASCARTGDGRSCAGRHGRRTARSRLARRGAVIKALGGSLELAATRCAFGF